MKLSSLASAPAALTGIGLAACGGATATSPDDAGPDAEAGTHPSPDASADEGAAEAGPDAEAGDDVTVAPECCAPPPKVATPSCSPTPGTFSSAQLVTLTDTTPGATIFYTLDGTNPNPNSPVFATPISIIQSTTLVRAYATVPGYTPSDVASCMYTINVAGWSNN